MKTTQIQVRGDELESLSISLADAGRSAAVRHQVDVGSAIGSRAHRCHERAAAASIARQHVLGAGGKPQPLTSAAGIAIDDSNRLYVAEMLKHRVTVFELPP